ncbi:hypothetical protein VTK73DRAFT_3647 [Phialemonium thermophilum]|uniref:GFO/IDH/MocA-like oxidoreductase domain-containing protein n=1 Tax=Phialemonium thermophilum TaxID=223376 RepID=A0ABR3WY17_9PEZI
MTTNTDRRFDSDFRTLQHLVHAGALGDVRDAQLHFDFPTPGWIQSWTQKEYQPGEGMAFGLGTHTIDQALCLFGRPASVTGLLRSNRGVESDVDDTFTILLQYGGAQKNLVVTVKTAVVTYMQDQLKFFVRGTKGTYLKFGTCPQEARAIASPGQPAVDPNFGVEDPRIWGTLTTVGPAPFDASAQAPVDATPPIATSVVGGQVFAGRYPSLPGWYRGYYENVADVVRGRRPREELAVQPQTARDGLRVIELARESHRTGRTVPWSSETPAGTTAPSRRSRGVFRWLDQ